MHACWGKRIVVLMLGMGGMSWCWAGMQVNQVSKHYQRHADVAVAADGRSVVAWWSSRYDGRGGGIYVRYYGADGLPEGDEFKVNISAGIRESMPVVAIADSGEVVVVWTTSSDSDQANDIVFRQFDPNGMPLTDEVAVNTYTFNRQIDPRIAMNAAGDFVVVWETWLGVEEHFNMWFVAGRSFYANGTPRSEEFLVHDAPNSKNAGVALQGTGDIVVVWGQALHFDINQLLFRRFNPQGMALGEPIEVLGDMDSNSFPEIAVDANDGFMIAGSYHPTHVNLRDVYAQVFDATGQAQSEQFVVNQHADGFQSSVTLAAKPAGGFVIAWYGEGKRGSYGIYARGFDAQALPTSQDTTVAYCSRLDSANPEIAVPTDGRLFCVWHSLDLDGSQTGVFRREINVP